MNANSDLLKRKEKKKQAKGLKLRGKCLCRFSLVYEPIFTIQDMSNITWHSVTRITYVLENRSHVCGRKPIHSLSSAVCTKPLMEEGLCKTISLIFSRNQNLSGTVKLIQ